MAAGTGPGGGGGGGPGDRSRSSSSSSSYLTVPGAGGRSDSKAGAGVGPSIAGGGVFRGGRRRSSARVSGLILVKKKKKGKREVVFVLSSRIFFILFASEQCLLFAYLHIAGVWVVVRGVFSTFLETVISQETFLAVRGGLRACMYQSEVSNSRSVDRRSVRLRRRNAQKQSPLARGKAPVV